MKKTEYEEEPTEIREKITPLANELSERLAAIDPTLILTLCSRKNAPEKIRGHGQEDTFTVTFRDFSNSPPGKGGFTSAFAKAGNGFANIHGD
jgi:hypothetical protein